MEPTLHPNLAKLAAAYDVILERLSRHQISPVQARSEIAQLEARDDQGVRWSIDPDSGEWVRKTALGDVEFDAAPPTFGYMTPDAFDYTANPQVFNPSDRLALAPVNTALQAGPSALAGATQRPRPGTAGATLPAWVRTTVRRVKQARRTTLVRAGLVGTAVVLLAYSCAGHDAAPSKIAPGPAPTGKIAPATSKAHPSPHPVVRKR